MAQTIKLKRSAQSGASGIPSTSDLALGEVGINTYHGKMYIKKDDGTESIVEVGSTASFLPLSGGTLTGNLNLGDNVKAQFGASDDLQIFHTGSYSAITDVGSGSLFIGGSTFVDIGNASLSETSARFYPDGAVTLYHDNSIKIATTATGADITGVLTADGLTVETTTPVVDILADANEDASLRLRENGTGIVGAEFTYDGGDNYLYLKVGNNTNTKRLAVSRDTGDISFYEDTGTTPKLFWDASGERLGLTGSDYQFYMQQGANQPWYHRAVSDGSYRLHLNGSGDTLTINSSGNATFSGSVTAGGHIITNTSSRIENQRISMEADGTLDWGSSKQYGTLTWDTNKAIIVGQQSSSLEFRTNGTGVAMTMDTSQNVNIPNGSLMVGATTAPTDKLEIRGNVKVEQTSNTDAIIRLNSNSGTIGSNYRWELVGGNSAASYGFQIREGTTPYLTINNSAGGNAGNVGIGTNNPTFATGGGLQVQADSFSSVRVTETGNTGIDFSQASDGKGYVYNRDNADVIFGTNNTEVLRLNASGNLGLNCTPSAHAFSKAIQIGDGAVWTVSGNQNSTFASNAYLASNGSFKYIAANKASKINLYNGGFTVATTNTSGSADGDITFTDRLTINADGSSVFSGSVTSTGLTLTGATGSISKVRFQAEEVHGDIEGINIGSNFGGLAFKTNTNGTLNTALTLDSSQNASFSGAVTSTGLTVNAAQSNFNDSAGSVIAFQKSASAKAWIANRSYGFHNGNGLAINTTDANPIRFGTNNTERMRIDSSGNVGIGQTSLVNGDKLTVNGNFNLNGTLFNGTSNNSAGLNFTSNYVNMYGYSGIRFYAQAAGIGSMAERMRIDSSGRLLLGLNSASGYSTDQDNFIIKGSAEVGMHIIGGTSSTTAINFGDGTGTAAYRGQITYHNADDSMRLNTAGQEAARFTSGGTLLVGKTTLDGNTVGSALFAGGDAEFVKQGTALYLNRKDSDGNIVQFRRDGTTKGNISVSAYGMGFGGGTRSSDFFIKTDGTASFASGVNVGIGISSSIADKLHLNGVANASTGITIGNNNSTRLRLYHNDAAGASYLTTDGMQTEQQLRIQSGSFVAFDNNGSESARLTSGGEFLIGCTSAGDAGITLDGSPSGNSVPSMELVRDFSGTATMIRFTNISGSPYVGSITSTTSATAYNTSSDERLKDNIKDADDSGSKVDAIQVRQFDWKADGEHQDYGMVAQELLEVAPDAVTKGDTPDDMMGVDYSKLVPMLIKEIQSLRQRVAQLEE